MSTSKRSVEIEDFHVMHGGARLHVVAAGPCRSAPVLLLHGRQHDATTWDDLGTVELLASRDYRAIAIDLPGFGTTDALKVSPNTFLAEVLPALEIERPLVVAPSMSARYAFAMAIRASGHMSGMVLIAPMSSEDFGPRLACAGVRTLIVWGELDHRFPPAMADALAAQIPGSELVLLPGAGHACHLDQPDLFHEHLLRFVDSVYR